VIEARILSRFYRKQDARYVRGDSFSFKDEVEEARRFFEDVRESGQSVTNGGGFVKSKSRLLLRIAVARIR
jgi:hypothetical protein